MVWEEIIKWIGGEIKLPKSQDWKAQCVRKTEDQFSFSMEGGGMENQVRLWIGIRLARVLNVWLTILYFILWVLRAETTSKLYFMMLNLAAEDMSGEKDKWIRERRY